MTDDMETGEGDPEEVDPEAAARAQAIVESMRGKFLDWLKTTEGALAEHLTALEPGGDASGAADRQAVVEAVTVIAHEMRGLGGTFGYPLISTFGDMLYEFTQTDVKIRDNVLEIAKAHLDVMRAVINDRVSGKGGSIGQDLQLSLDQAIKKYSGD